MDFTRKMIDFDTFTKNAKECGRFGQIFCWQMLYKVAQSPKNRPIWSHCDHASADPSPLWYQPTYFWIRYLIWFFSWGKETLVSCPLPMTKLFPCAKVTSSCGFKYKKTSSLVTPASFSLIFGLFKQTIQILQQINVKKCPNVHPVYGTRIRTHNLTYMSRHP